MTSGLRMRRSVAVVADAELTLLELIADEQILDDGDDLFAAEKIKAVPPTLELQETRALAVDPVEQVRVLCPDCLFRLKALEVARQRGTVETAIAEIGQEMRQPDATQEPAGDAHRVDAGLPRPVGQRRAVEYHRAGQALAIRRQ